MTVPFRFFRTAFIKKLFTAFLIIVWVFSGFPPFLHYTPFGLGEAEAAVSDIGIWRDSAGSQIPGTTFAAFNFATEERNDGIYTFTGNNNLNLNEAGNYLLIATLKLDDSSNGRVNYEGRFTYTGSGNFVTSYGSAYSRNGSNRTAWVRVVGLVWGAAVDDDVQLEMRRDTDAPTAGSIANASHFQVVRLNGNEAVGMYTDSADTGAYGTQTWTDAPFNTVVHESDTSVIQRQAGNTDIRLKKNNTTFLIGYGMAFGTGGSRTQRVTKMVAGTSDITNSFSYAYQRNGANEYIAPNGLFLYRNSGTSTDLSVQAQRGNADVAGSAVRRTSTSGMFVVELPASAESFISHDGTGNQDISSAGALGDINAMAVVDHNDAAGFTKVNNTTVNVEKNMNALFMGQVYVERTDTSGTRLTTGARFEIAGTDQTLGEHGNFLRGNQGTQDTYNMVLSPSGIYNVSNGDDVQLEYFDAGDNGSADVTQANKVGFSALNLDSLIGDAPVTNQLHFRWRDDSTDLNTSGGFLAAEDSNAIGNLDKNVTRRLRIEVANTGTQAEGAARTYELQWGEKVTSCNAISTWTGLANASDAFDMVATTHITPDGEATTSGLLANTESYTRINGEGRESADTTGTIGPLSASNYTELEFSFEATTHAITGHTYCFRVYDTTAGAAIDAYSNYPEVTIDSVAAITTLGEAGTFTSAVDGGWTTINFTNTYTTPVVVGTTNTTGGTENALIFESKSVTSTSADMRVCESNGDGTCDTHGTETVGYMVIDADVTSSIAGIEAGTFTASGDYDVNGTTVNYAETFGSTPYVFGAVQTVAGTPSIEFRMDSVSQTGFVGGICRQNGTDTCDGAHGNETVGWVALEPGNLPFVEQNEMGTVLNTGGGSWNSVTFASAFSATPVVVSEVQTFSGTQELMIDENRSVTTTGVDVRFCELDGPDTCDSHNSNTVAWFAIESGTLTVTPGYVLDQATFRFYDNTDAIQPTVAKAAENTAITDVESDDIIRIRMSVQTGLANLAASEKAFKLQYGEGGTCSAIGTWTDVDSAGGSGAWRGYDNTTPTDGAAITSSLLDGGSNALESYEEENNSVNNPAVINKGSKGEWDWVVQNNAATGATTYCFRMVDTDGNVMHYTNYPKVTTIGVTMTQNYFRFYVDNDALDPTDPWPAGATDLGENAEITSSDEPLATGDVTRIRMSIAISGNNLAALGQDFKLQFGERVTTCGAIGSWNDLGNPGSGAIWRGFNATPSDGINLSGNPPTAGDLNISVSDRAGTYEEQNNTALNPFQVSTGEDVEYDWNVENNGATAEKTYCFRMVESGGTVLDGYNFYPAAHTSGFTPKSQNWRWYDDETNETPTSALAAENTTPSDVENENIIKLRLTINDTSGGGASNIKFKIQFSEYSDFSQDVTDAVEIGSCTANSLWCYGDGTDTDDDAITTRVLTDSTANGVHNESGVSTSTFDPAGSTPIEFEFTLKHAGARVGATYYFRAYDVTNNSAVETNTGESYPSLIAEGPALTFTIDGVATSTVTEGITTDVTTTSTTIPFGSVPLDTELESAQRITVDTNATTGYQVLAFARSDFLGDKGDIIEPVTGTNSSPSGWGTGCLSTSDSCFGYHAGDNVLEGGSTRFAPDDSYAALTATPSEVAYSATPVNSEVTDVVYKMEVHLTQPADDYTTDIVYIATPVF